MKKCPYCAEEIQDDTIKCNHCGSDLTAPLKIGKAVEHQKRKNIVPSKGCLITILVILGIWIIAVLIQNYPRFILYCSLFLMGTSVLVIANRNARIKAQSILRINKKLNIIVISIISIVFSLFLILMSKGSIEIEKTRLQEKNIEIQQQKIVDEKIQSKKTQYDNLLKEANLFFNKKSFNEAYLKYEEASKLIDTKETRRGMILIELIMGKTESAKKYFENSLKDLSDQQITEIGKGVYPNGFLFGVLEADEPAKQIINSLISTEITRRNRNNQLKQAENKKKEEQERIKAETARIENKKKMEQERMAAEAERTENKKKMEQEIIIAKTAREMWAKKYEEDLLSQGLDVTVKLSGKNKTTVKITYVLLSRPWVYKLTHDPEYLTNLQNLGFQKVIFSDGYFNSWYYNIE